MARTARHVVAGGCYHVMNRGNAKATVFHDRDDYSRFQYLLERALDRTPVDVFASCLMPNHFHLVVRPRGKGDLGILLHWLATTHARWHHLHHRTTGRIWQGRYRTCLVQDDAHLLTVIRYVERNALRANLVSRAEEWRWGSLAWRCGRGPARLLAEPPIRLPAHWTDYVNEPQTEAELKVIRQCVQRGQPIGNEGWVTEQRRG
jgi:putative transposase